MAVQGLGGWKQGVQSGLPVFMGYFAVSFTFGIAALRVLSPFQAVLMSATNYTSAGQFAALGIIAASAGYWELAATQLVINLRYCLMSCSVAGKLESGTPLRYRLLYGVGMTDEVFGLLASRPGTLSPGYILGVMGTALPGWVLGTLCGAVAHSLMPARVLSALGIAIYAMFIAVVIPPTRGNRVILGLVLATILCSVLFDQIPLLAGISSGFKIILLTLLIAGAAAVLFPIAETPAPAEEDLEQPRGGEVQ